MSFFTDAVPVTFTGLSHIFNVSSVFCQFTVFGREFIIHWYGVIIAFGFACAAVYGGRIAYTWRMSINKMLDVLVYGTLGGIIGARLYYVIFKWDYYSQFPSEIIKIWHGGLGIYGGLIAGILAAYITCKAEKLNFVNLLDLAGMSFLIGQGIGRWGNFANQEAFGTNTTAPWGMYSSKVAYYLTTHQAEFAAEGITVDPSKPVHPTFLYESLWCLLGFLLLYFICKKHRRFQGELFLIYCIWYGCGRAVIEGFRTDSLYIPGTTLRISQVLSMCIVIAALITLLVISAKYRRHPWPVDGRDFFIDSEGERQTDLKKKYTVKKIDDGKKTKKKQAVPGPEKSHADKTEDVTGDKGADAPEDRPEAGTCSDTDDKPEDK